MTDIFESIASGLEAPASGAVDIIPNDDNDLPITPRALYVGIGGTVQVEMKWGGQITFHNVPDAALLPIRPVRVLTATTASSIVGLY